MISDRISGGIIGSPIIPGDKSISHRSIIIPSISNGICKVKNILKSDDVLHTLEAFKNIDPNIGILCDQYTIIELEMFLEKKNLLGQVTSLAIYAEKFGSKYKLINFDGYKGFKDNSEFFMPDSINKWINIFNLYFIYIL